MIHTLADAANWLEGLIDHERSPAFPYKRLGLEPIRALLARLGDPHAGLRVLHIAGSKGKGSTALLSEAVLGAAGLSVGTFTSPHLERWTERFRLDGRAVSEQRLADAVERIRPHVEAMRAAGGESVPTFFDATTAAALLLFHAAEVDCAVLEVGLGGRLDSTNVVCPAVTCLTGVELEHTDKLGSTLVAIAGEKVGIAKPGVPLVTGMLAPEVERVVEARSIEVGAPLVRLGRDFHVEVLGEDLTGSRLRVRDEGLELEARIPVLGAHQAANAALAIACARRLPEQRFGDDAFVAAVERGLGSVELPGRVELLGSEPWLVVDGAHTGASASALAAVLARLPRRRLHLVLSISANKDTAAILVALLPAANRVTVTRAESTRSLAPSEVAAAVRARAPDLALQVVPNPHLAVRAARESLGPEDALCVTGSVYLAGIARRVLREGSSEKPLVSAPQPRT